MTIYMPHEDLNNAHKRFSKGGVVDAEFAVIPPHNQITQEESAAQPPVRVER